MRKATGKPINRRYEVNPLLAPKAPSCDVSIIIVNWNTRELLRLCLSSVIKHTKVVNYEIVVVDNASQDGSCEMLEAELPQVRIHCNTRNEGFSFGCNEGMRMARGRYFLLLNSDTILIEDAVSKMVAFMDRHQDIGISGCALLNEDGSLQPSCAWFPTPFSAITQGLKIWDKLKHIFQDNPDFASPFLSYTQHQRQNDVDWIAGAFMLVRRQVAEQVSMLDETIFFYNEEVDWCYRMKQAGWRIVFTPETKIIHIGGGSTTLPDFARCTAILNNYYYYFHKNFGPAWSRMYILLTLLSSPLKIMIWLTGYVLYASGRRLFLERILWNFNALRWCFMPAGRRIAASKINDPQAFPRNEKTRDKK